MAGPYDYLQSKEQADAAYDAYTPGGSATPAAAGITSAPIQRSPLNGELGGVKILRADDRPVMDDNDKPVPGKWIRILRLEDGTLKSYSYDVIAHPENATGQVTDWVPVGATYLGDSEDTPTATNYINKQALEFNRQRAVTQDQQQNASEAGNQANQTGYVMVPGPDGSPIQKLDPNGQPIPTLGREQFNRQTAAQEVATGVQKEQNDITRERNAAQAIYEQKTLDATKERDRINGLVALGTLDANKAKEKFDEWMQLNVTIPFKQMEEARARATEARQAQQLEDQRRQNAATFEQERNKTALGVGNEAIKASVATLPYMAGPNWGSQFGNALSAVAKGRPQDIHFDSSGLNFQSPDFQKIAEDATARALAHLSPYAQAIAQAGDRPGGAYTQTDYSQVPNIPSVQGAPTSQPLGGYSPGGSAPMPSAPDPNAGMPSEQWR